MSNDNRCSGGQLLLAFLAGAAVGAAVALLTSPRTGKENRDRVADWMKRAREEAAGAGPQVKSAVDQAVQAAGEAFDRAFRPRSG